MLRSIEIEKDPRSYLHCTYCTFIFVHPRHHLPLELEKARYLEHNNGADEPGYVTFLERVLAPSRPFLKKGMRLLDYGCGFKPTLSVILKKEGYDCHDYDPIFGFEHPFEQYDHIFSVECFEHFFEPARDIKKIVDLMAPGASLCIMTEQWESLERFHRWYYKRDPSHVSFFNKATFEYLCEVHQLTIEYRDRNRVVILRKH